MSLDSLSNMQNNTEWSHFSTCLHGVVEGDLRERIDKAIQSKDVNFVQYMLDKERVSKISDELLVELFYQSVKWAQSTKASAISEDGFVKAMHLAIKEDRVQIFAFLLQCETISPDRLEEILYLAASNQAKGNRSMQIVEMLLRHKKIQEVPANGLGSTILAWAVKNSYFFSLFDQRSQDCTSMENIRNLLLRVLLFWAIEIGSEEIIEFLVRCKRKDGLLLEDLLEAQARANEKGHDQISNLLQFPIHDKALHPPSENRHIELFELVVYSDKREEFFLEVIFLNILFRWSIENNRKDIVEELLCSERYERAREILASNLGSALFFTTRKGNKEIVKLLLRYADPLEISQNYIRYAFFIAARYGYTSIVEFFLENETAAAAISIEVLNVSFQAAVANGQGETIDFLLECARKNEIQSNYLGVAVRWALASSDPM